MEITISIQVCLIWWMNFDSKENGGRKSFSYKTKHQYLVTHCGEHDCSANNKKNRDSYEYPSLSHFSDALWL